MVSRSRIGRAVSKRRHVNAAGRDVGVDAVAPFDALLGMQRTAGNRATAAAIRRIAVKDASGTLIEHRFEVSSDIAPALASAAKKAVKVDAVSARARDLCDLLRDAAYPRGLRCDDADMRSLVRAARCLDAVEQAASDAGLVP